MEVHDVSQQQLVLKAHLLAVELGPEWSYTLSYSGRELEALNHSSGYGLLLSNLEGERCEVSCKWPTARDGTCMYPHKTVGMTFSRNRTEASIAKEIQRRILTVYPDLWEDLNQQALAHDREEERQDELVQQLKVLTGWQVARHRRSLYYSWNSTSNLTRWDPLLKRRVSEGSGRTFMSVRTEVGRDIDIEIHGVSPEIAREVLELLVRLLPAPNKETEG